VAASATSAAGLGGMAALVDAAKKEGALNVIALPPDRANYGQVIRGFQAKYGLAVNSA
jgi:putative spermidine/putrescine transport system substrate-binding protein